MKYLILTISLLISGIVTANPLLPEPGTLKFKICELGYRDAVLPFLESQLGDPVTPDELQFSKDLYLGTRVAGAYSLVMEALNSGTSDVAASLEVKDGHYTEAAQGHLKLFSEMEALGHTMAICEEVNPKQIETIRFLRELGFFDPGVTSDGVQMLRGLMKLLLGDMK